MRAMGNHRSRERLLEHGGIAAASNAALHYGVACSYRPTDTSGESVLEKRPAGSPEAPCSVFVRQLSRLLPDLASYLIERSLVVGEAVLHTQGKASVVSAGSDLLGSCVTARTYVRLRGVLGRADRVTSRRAGRLDRRRRPLRRARTGGDLAARTARRAGSVGGNGPDVRGPGGPLSHVGRGDWHQPSCADGRGVGRVRQVARAHVLAQASPGTRAAESGRSERRCAAPGALCCDGEGHPRRGRGVRPLQRISRLVRPGGR